MNTVTADRGGHRNVDAGHGRATALAVLALLAATGIAVVWTGPSAPPAPPPPAEIVVIGGRDAATPATADAPPPAPTADAATTAPRLAYDPLTGRIDPLLDTIMATADGDVRTLHDQIAQQGTGGRDAAREAALDTALSAATGTRPMRIICAGAICEIVGRTGSRRSLENEALGDRLARQNLSAGPVAYGRAESDGDLPFVQYVVAEDQ